MAFEVIVDRARASTRATAHAWEGPTQSDVTDPEDYDVEGPRIYAPRDEDAADNGPELADFRDYGEPRDWPSVSRTIAAGGFPRADADAAAAADWLPKRGDPVRATGRCDGFPPRPVGASTGINHYDSNQGAISNRATPIDYPGLGFGDARLQAAPRANRWRIRNWEVV